MDCTSRNGPEAKPKGNAKWAKHNNALKDVEGVTDETLLVGVGLLNVTGTNCYLSSLFQLFLNIPVILNHFVAETTNTSSILIDDCDQSHSNRKTSNRNKILLCKNLVADSLMMIFLQFTRKDYIYLLLCGSTDAPRCCSQAKVPIIGQETHFVCTMLAFFFKQCPFPACQQK